MKFSFFDEPTAVVEYLQNKNAELHFDYDEIVHDAHKRAFTIAKMTDLDLLKDVQSSLSHAFKNGVGFEEWKKQIKPKLAAKGWLGETQVINPKTGEVKKIYVGNRRLKTIYNTNMRTAYAQARYQSQMEASGEYFRYVAVLDRLTRPAHKRMHGVVIPKTDKFWDKNYPPNGWNCRCKVQVLSKEQLKSRGITPLADGSFLKDVASKDFAYNPGKSADQLDEILSKKQSAALAALRPKEQAKLKEQLAKFEHERDLYTWQSGLNYAVDELLVKKNLKAPISVFALGRLSDDIVKKSEKVLDIKIETTTIVGDKHGILHIRPERKSEYGQDLRLDEIRRIVDVLDDKDTPVSVDTKNKNILFWFDDEQDDTKINKIVVDLNYKLKKFGLTNYMVTVGKVDKTSKDEAEYIKIR
ncbi:phage head morphogenesis protein [Campylobacter sp. 7477a]|uniref:phage head morphogenesis protein n=1 Tax=Campylobacter sp. 7477a TaxID=2735741 RepID=UPI0030148663|nr:minor capsid protein [Campylobacter sp. 7477a]